MNSAPSAAVVSSTSSSPSSSSAHAYAPRGAPSHHPPYQEHMHPSPSLSASASSQPGRSLLPPPTLHHHHQFHAHHPSPTPSSPSRAVGRFAYSSSTSPPTSPSSSAMTSAATPSHLSPVVHNSKHNYSNNNNGLNYRHHHTHMLDSKSDTYHRHYHNSISTNNHSSSNRSNTANEKEEAGDSGGEGSEGSSNKKKKLPRVSRACLLCRKSHAACDTQRPCTRCVSHGKAAECRDPEPKRRGRKPRSRFPPPHADSLGGGMLPSSPVGDGAMTSSFASTGSVLGPTSSSGFGATANFPSPVKGYPPSGGWMMMPPGSGPPPHTGAPPSGPPGQPPAEHPLRRWAASSLQPGQQGEPLPPQPTSAASSPSPLLIQFRNMHSAASASGSGDSSSPPSGEASSSSTATASAPSPASASSWFSATNGAPNPASDLSKDKRTESILFAILEELKGLNQSQEELREDQRLLRKEMNELRASAFTNPQFGYPFSPASFASNGVAPSPPPSASESSSSASVSSSSSSSSSGSSFSSSTSSLALGHPNPSGHISSFTPPSSPFFYPSNFPLMSPPASPSFSLGGAPPYALPPAQQSGSFSSNAAEDREGHGGSKVGTGGSGGGTGGRGIEYAPSCSPALYSLAPLSPPLSGSAPFVFSPPPFYPPTPSSSISSSSAYPSSPLTITSGDTYDHSTEGAMMPYRSSIAKATAMGTSPTKSAHFSGFSSAVAKGKARIGLNSPLAAPPPFSSSPSFLNSGNQHLQIAIPDTQKPFAIMQKFNGEGIITVVNDAFCKLYHYEEEELIGKTWRMLIPPHMYTLYKQACIPLTKPSLNSASSVFTLRAQHQTKEGIIFDTLTKHQIFYETTGEPYWDVVYVEEYNFVATSNYSQKEPKVVSVEHFERDKEGSTGGGTDGKSDCKDAPLRREGQREMSFDGDGNDYYDGDNDSTFVKDGGKGENETEEREKKTGKRARTNDTTNHEDDTDNSNSKQQPHQNRTEQKKRRMSSDEEDAEDSYPNEQSTTPGKTSPTLISSTSRSA
ncbi:hypothetical protein QOT17_007510 [Balamuthia mandrillaris]